MSNKNPITTAEALAIELLQIKTAAAGIQSLLDAALSNASGNPEFESVKRRVEAFEAALGGLPVPANDDSALLDGLEKLAIDHDVDIVQTPVRFSIFTDRENQGPDLRQAIRNAIKR